MKNPESIPSVIADQISLNPHKYPTRSKHPLLVKNNNTSYGSKLMSCKWSKHWNSLPHTIQNAQSKNLFKKHFYNHILANYTSSQLNFPNLV